MARAAMARLERLLARLPGLGPRSARRILLYLLKRRETLLLPLAQALAAMADEARVCSTCGNLDVCDPCAICSDPRRNPALLCVVEDVGDLWAVERTRAYTGHYHVLGGTLSALDGIAPDDLSIAALLERARQPQVQEVILALNATLNGQSTVHYLSERLAPLGCAVTRLAHGVPVGGELDYLDEGTLTTALRARRPPG